MKEVNSDFFSKIANFVNSPQYLNSKYEKIELINFDSFDDEKINIEINAKLKVNGYCVMQLSNDTFIDDSRLACILSKILGEPFTDKNPKKEVYAKVQAENGSKYYINSNLAQPIHTDEGYTKILPRFGALYCVKESNVGGDSVIVKFDNLYQSLLKKFGTVVDLLFKPNAVIVKSAFGIVEKPILLKLVGDDIGISYSPVLQKMWCSEEVFELYKYITNYVHANTNQLRFKLKENQVLIFDNCRTLHGRTGFLIDDPRLLYRFWFQKVAI